MRLLKLFTLILFTTSFIYAESITDELEKSFKSTKTSNLEDEAKRLSALGSLSHQKGDYETALQYYDKSLSIREKLGYIEDINYANILFLSAIASHKSGNSCKALNKMKNVITVYKVLAPEEKILAAQKEINDIYQPACNTNSLISKK